MNTADQAALSDALNRLWAKFLPEMRQRLSALETAAAAFAAGTLTIDQCEAASAAAHKLAGVLGTFNLTAGTVLARELEAMYSRKNGPDPALGSRFTLIAGELRDLVESRK